VEECRLRLVDNSVSESPGGSWGSRGGGVIAVVLTGLTSVLVVCDRPAVAISPVMQRGSNVSNLLIISADALVSLRTDPSSQARRDALTMEKCKIKANREMRIMRSDEDLSRNGHGIAQKSKPNIPDPQSSGPLGQALRRNPRMRIAMIARVIPVLRAVRATLRSASEASG
jgi:hypothetical protein